MCFYSGKNAGFTSTCLVIIETLCRSKRSYAFFVRSFRAAHFLFVLEICYKNGGNMMKNKNVYGYLIVSDDGFAPCYDDGLFTLACCKPDIRKSIFKNHIDENGKVKDDVWVIAFRHGDQYENGEYETKLVYVAKITGVLNFEEYYDCADYQSRTDCIYKNLKTGCCEKISGLKGKDREESLKKLIKKAYRGKPDYHIIKCKSNPTGNELDQFRRDVSGLCVLISSEYYYFGNEKLPKELEFAKEHCRHKRPGRFFYVDIKTDEIDALIKKFANHKNIKAPLPENKKRVCGC